ncbi:replication-relaxation family protein [Streptomyces sp. RKAG293]|uniref:replication-relaxation family protein n=1 Tax=Streptomyces sp. RKAG293 TaxID=2893403 RepID=UPI0020347660|nr:replication-relaxation family protein [Streptomyces sp. RKAG293]MCM2424161.1 replication-relaxation family protein [Streptomyces sp. RKAG293]
MPYPAGMPPAHSLSRLAEELLPVLYQHRLMTTSQLHQLMQPHTAHAVYVRRQLNRLRELQLVETTLRRRGGRGELAWYCTGLGAEVVEASGEVRPRSHRLTEQTAAFQLQEHTLAVNATGLAFVAAARAAGHECGPLDWEPELAHRLRDGDSRIGDEAFLVPDAVLSYIHRQHSTRTIANFFLEIDRATMTPDRLVDKLRAYARYQSYHPTPIVTGRPRTGSGTPGGGAAWRNRYPVFPRVLFVLAGAPPAALDRRIADLRALAAADSRLQRAAQRLTAGVTTLHQLQTAGPWEPIVVPVFGEDATLTTALLHAPAAEAA